MVDYDDCYETCECFYYDKEKEECAFKKLCVIMELPIEVIK